MLPANQLKKISLLQYRNYASASFAFDTAITCITGPNGSGKTNLLDAIYFLCYTKSYFTALQQNNVQAGTDGFRISGAFLREGRDETITCKWRAAKKEIFRNDIAYEKLTDHIGRYSAVMIAPDDTELVNGGSELRRRWIDSILGQVDKVYLEKLMHYQRVLLQRNAWLKMQAGQPVSDFAELDYYNTQMAADASYIFSQRTSFITDFVPVLAQVYCRLSGGKESPGLIYQSDLAQKNLFEWLHSGLPADLRMQRTLRGIHKDDLELTLNGMSLKQFGSQGQKKSFLFALKLAQYRYLTKQLGHKPMLLLDDIFEKLDQSRIEALLSIICSPEFGQVLLTDTHAERIKAAFGPASDISFIAL